MWDFQFNTKVVQQSYENQLLFNQIKILNISCKNNKESSLNILLEEVLAADTVN